MDTRVSDRAIPLAVDLDGTLIAGDLLWEAVFVLLRKAPWLVFAFPFWLAKGKSVFKDEIFSRVELEPDALAYRADVIEWLEGEKAAGRSNILATASCAQKAQQIADHLGLFADVAGSDRTTNLKSKAKLALLVEKYGDGGFDYAGNSADDVVLFDAARRAIVVAPDQAAQKWAVAHDITPMVAADRTSLKDVIKMLRVHQWAKNLLIAVPAILDHQFFQFGSLLAIAGAFFAFSFLASSVYIFNDLFDLAMDRKHPTKSKRPLPAGRIMPVTGVKIALGLIVAAATISLFLPPLFGAVLAGYFVITTAYSLKLKRWLLLDVLTLAGLYTVRVIAGIAVVAAAPSFWLLAFSTFFFLSLALVKRYVELDHSTIGEKERLSGRGYRPEDKEVIMQAGMASAFASIVVLALYLDSEAIYQLYAHPWMIWPLCPLVLYIIMRVWILAKRKEFNDDPVVFISTDWRSQMMVGFGALLMLIAGFYPPVS
ncbi:MAG: UbiA family prenyltransferase [Pseudomonadota bacterium]